MNWIIKNRSKLKFHTNLDVLLKPIEDDIQRFNWLINDLEINSSELGSLPINHDKDWFYISSKQMEELRISDTQIVWGAFSAIDNKSNFQINEDILPYAEGVSEIWKNGNLQVNESEIEIIAWDSSFTIVKFTDEYLSSKFKDYFDEAIELEKYKWKKKSR